MEKAIALATGSIVAFLLTYTLTPPMIRVFRKAGMVSVDLHKVEHVWIPAVGGLVVLPAYLFSLGVAFPILGFEKGLEVAWYSSLTILLVGLLGVLDELRPLRQRYKFLLPAIFSYPLVALALSQSETKILFPMGSLEFGWLYPFIFVPLALTTASNLTNILAGFNGLEAGMGFIACLTISAIAIVEGKVEAAILTLPMATALIAFLRYNWYPAKIFPGDSGTLLIGAVIATAAIVGKLELVCMILLIPHAIDFTFKLISRRPFSQRYIYGDTRARKDGVLIPPPYQSLPHLFMLVEPLTEERLVKVFLLLEAMFALVAVAFFIFI